MKKVICLLCLTLGLFVAAPAAAAAEFRGSIQIELEAGDLAVTNGAVTLYQVGVKTEEGYRIREHFGGGMIRQEDIGSDNLARWLAESAMESGNSMLLDADGFAVFPELEEGLYLLVQTERMDGFYPINPILLTVPEENRWDLRIYREPVPIVTDNPKTGESPMLFLGILGMVFSTAGLFLCAGKNRKHDNKGRF